MRELHGTWGGAGHLLAKASASKGSARFAFHLPALVEESGVQLQVTAAPSDYKPVSSGVSKVTIV